MKTLLLTMLTQNLSTFRATREETHRFDAVLKKLAIGSRSHFFRCVTMQFVEQTEQNSNGGLPEWPPEFMTRQMIRGKPPATQKNRKPGIRGS